MKKTLKRTLAMIMSLSMLATTTAFTASAEEVSSDSVKTITSNSADKTALEEATTTDSKEETEDSKTIRSSGSLGENISFEISNDGVMTV